MQQESRQRISLLELILSFAMLGVIAVIAILIWKRGETLDFLARLFSFDNFVRNVILGILIGVFATILIVVLVKVTNTKLPKNPYTELLKEIMKQPYGPVVVGVLPGFFEEILFRGFLLSLGISIIGIAWAVIITSLIFCGLHIPQYRNKWIVNLYVFILSIILSYLFVWTHTLWAPIVAHTVYNYLVTHLTLRGYIGFDEE